ncbi:MAG: helix-turn-helix transcriptional regulator [Geminicoccaceae bacterium]
MSERSAARAEINARVRNINARLGSWLRLERHRRNLSQKQVGQLLGVCYQQMYKYEKGQNRISADQLLVLVAEFQVDLGTLTEAVFGELPLAAASLRQSRIERRLQERIASLTPGQQQGVLSMLEALGEDTPRSWVTPELVAC